MKTKHPPRESARITAHVGTALPLLVTPDGAEYPVYTGPLGTARLFVARDRYVLEMAKNAKFNVFLAADPAGLDCREWSLSYVSMETALREALGVYFHRAGYDAHTLGPALRAVLEHEIDHLNGATS